MGKRETVEEGWRQKRVVGRDGTSICHQCLGDYASKHRKRLLSINFFSILLLLSHKHTQTYTIILNLASWTCFLYSIMSNPSKFFKDKKIEDKVKKFG